MARLEVITGPMFSGKSEELKRRLIRAAYAKKKILLIKAGVDDREVRNIFNIVREDSKLSSYEFLTTKIVNSTKDMGSILDILPFDIIAIDEAQFFKKWFVKRLEKILDACAKINITIIISGLDMDAWKKPFGNMPYLLSLADDVQKLTAICVHCQGANGPGIFTQKKPGGSKNQVEVGSDIYEARCRVCHYIPQ